MLTTIMGTHDQTAAALEAVRKAAETYAEAREAYERARDDLYREMRAARPHTTLRDLADAGGVSFQRVHQIVGPETADETP
jgi:hypothetical protein